MSLDQGTLAALEATSRTFFIPITRLPGGLLEAVASAYLCLRAIDEVEDHPDLGIACKAAILGRISETLQSRFCGGDLSASLHPWRAWLPEVTLQLPDWVALAPPAIAPRIWDATAAMADRMAGWAAGGWQIRTESDLDRYTYGVAGAVGILLSDLWAWHDGTVANRAEAIGFGRGLQAVNLLRNREEDLRRGVDLYPDGWGAAEMQGYAHRNLALAESYTSALPPGPALSFCRIPLTLARATLDALVQGAAKLTRGQVLDLAGEETGA